jgi:hypothetical protein
MTGNISSLDRLSSRFTPTDHTGLAVIRKKPRGCLKV